MIKRPSYQLHVKLRKSRRKIRLKFERYGDSSEARLGARTHGRHLISLIIFEIMRQIKNIRHQLPPIMIFQPVCTLDVYVCVERACLLIDMTSYKDAETPFLRICLRLEAEEFNRTVLREIFVVQNK